MSELKVEYLDNRDPGTTWLIIEDTEDQDYVEVNPFELIENMVENCRPWILEEEGVGAKELDDALALKGAVAQARAGGMPRQAACATLLIGLAISFTYHPRPTSARANRNKSS